MGHHSYQYNRRWSVPRSLGSWTNPDLWRWHSRIKAGLPAWHARSRRRPIICSHRQVSWIDVYPCMGIRLNDAMNVSDHGLHELASAPIRTRAAKGPSALPPHLQPTMACHIPPSKSYPTSPCPQRTLGRNRVQVRASFFPAGRGCEEAGPAHHRWNRAPLMCLLRISPSFHQHGPHR